MTKVKTFLQKWIINNIGYKILALVFAFVLWLVITNTIDPVTTRTITGIPVEILNEDKVLDGDHVYTILSGDAATVVVSGNRSIVGTLSASDFRATADFAELSMTNAIPINVELVGEKSRYAGSVTTTLKTNSMIISIEDMAEKEMNVEVEFSGEESDDLIVTDAVAAPVRVTLYAPETVIKQAAKIVAPIGYAEVTGDMEITKDLLIYDHSGNEIPVSEDVYLSEPKATVSIKTNRTRTVPIEIVPSGTPANGYELTGVDYSKNSVMIRGTEEALNQIGSIILPSELLSIQGANSDVSVTVDVANFLPAGVTLHGDTGNVTIVATISKTEAETEKETETETETEEETEG